MHLRSAKRLCELCCINGGCFIKVGQHIGSLEYLLPYEYVTTMRVLHSDAPKSPVEDVYKVIREELGKDVSARLCGDKINTDLLRPVSTSVPVNVQQS